MRITKPKERWFEVPDDPDGAAVQIRQLTPGQRQDIIDKAFVQQVTYHQGGDKKMKPIMTQKTDTRLDREQTIIKAVVDWKNFFDQDGAKLPCNPENIVRAIREIDGFAEFVADCRARLYNDLAEEEEDLEKNLQTASSGT
jgi:hypothetical protein